MGQVPLITSCPNSGPVRGGGGGRGVLCELCVCVWCLPCWLLRAPCCHHSDGEEREGGGGGGGRGGGDSGVKGVNRLSCITANFDRGGICPATSSRSNQFIQAIITVMRQTDRQTGAWTNRLTTNSTCSAVLHLSKRLESSSFPSANCWTGVCSTEAPV